MRDTISLPPRETPRRGFGFWGIVILTVLITVATFSSAAFGSGVSPRRSTVVPASSPGNDGTGGNGGNAGTTGIGGMGRGMVHGGAPPSRGIGLHLLVTADPPTLVDVDRGTTTPVAGLPGGGGWLYRALQVGDDAVIVGSQACAGCGRAGRAFVLQDGRAVPLGPARSVAPSLDGRAVWMVAHGDATRSTGCTLREVGLDGVPRHPAKPIDCRAQLRKETPAGILVDVPTDGYGPPDSALLHPATGEAVGRYPPVVAMTEHFTLTGSTERNAVPESGQYGRFVVIDMLSGTRELLPWPSRLGRTGEAAEDPTGRFLALQFVDSTAPGPERLMDVWVLDTITRRWLQVPQMPTYTDLAQTGMAWTSGGRLVVLGAFDGPGDAVVTWRPGEERLSYRRLDLPDARGTTSVVVVK